MFWEQVWRILAIPVWAKQWSDSADNSYVHRY
jgi:hypothetical protein